MSKSTQRINYLPGPPCVLSGSLRSCDSNFSSNSSCRGEVHFNGAYDSTESSPESSCNLHAYESIINAVSTGPRRKANFTYEPALPSPALPPRTRHITESDRYSRSSSSSSAEPLPKKGGAYLSKFMLFIILAVSAAALVLVILTIFGTLGPKCGCTDENTDQTPRTGMSGVSVKSLLRRIQDLEKNMIAMKDKTEARESAVNELVTKLKNQVEFLQKQVSKHRNLLNDTASKVAFVDGSAEKKLNTEIRLLNKSVNALKSNDNELMSKVNELRQNQSHAKRFSDRLTANVTQLQSRVQEFKKSNSDMSSRTGSLERGYAQMYTVVKKLQEVNGAQNASHEALRSAFIRMKDSMVIVNKTLYNELGRKIGANFSSCEHKMIKGTPVSPGTAADASATYMEPPNKRVVGIACSTDFADEFKLQSTQKGLYECTCRGVAPSAVNSKPATIHCHLHLWECPINT